MNERKSRKIKSKTLWEKTDDQAKLRYWDYLMRKPRYLPDSLVGMFTATIIIFDNKALFIPSATHQTAILITSKEITSTLQVMFDGLWLNAEKPEHS